MLFLSPELRRYCVHQLILNKFNIRNFTNAPPTETGAGGTREKEGLILGVYYNEGNNEPTLTQATQRFNDKISGRLFDLVKAAGGDIKRAGVRVFNNIDPEFWSVAVVGLGSEKSCYSEIEAIDERLEATRVGAGIGAQRLMSDGVKRFLIEGLGRPESADIGGLCLKSAPRMDNYRADMRGAAAIVASIRAAVALNLPININVCIPLCENMRSGKAMKCGDLVMSLNGKSIMIEDTDNEGRLCIADALTFDRARYKPRLIIDLASSTSGVKHALGSAAAGVFCNSQTMGSQVREAGVITGGCLWRTPLWKSSTGKVIDYPAHDVNNRDLGLRRSLFGRCISQRVSLLSRLDPFRYHRCRNEGS